MRKEIRNQRDDAELFIELCNENIELREELTFFKKELERVINMTIFEFAEEFCNDTQLEEAGHQLARSLGVGVRVSPEMAAIDDAENCYVPYEGDDF